MSCKFCIDYWLKKNKISIDEIFSSRNHFSLGVDVRVLFVCLLYDALHSMIPMMIGRYWTNRNILQKNIRSRGREFISFPFEAAVYGNLLAHWWINMNFISLSNTENYDVVFFQTRFHSQSIWFGRRYLRVVDYEYFQRSYMHARTTKNDNLIFIFIVQHSSVAVDDEGIDWERRTLFIVSF